MTSASLFSSPPPSLINIHTSKSISKSKTLTFSFLESSLNLKTTLKTTRKSSTRFTVNSSTSIIDNNPSSSGQAILNSSADENSEESNAPKIGSRVRVNVPLKVYHVPKLPEFDLTGKVGVLKQYVAFHKGKPISANLPYKVEFLEKVEGRDAPVKFVAHLKDDEFEYLDS